MLTVRVSFHSPQILSPVPCAHAVGFSGAGRVRTKAGCGRDPATGEADCGVSLQVQAVRLIAEGTAPRCPQPEEGATYEGIQKKETAKVSSKPSYPTLPVRSGWSAVAAQGSKVS